jgi:hypothetical protein
MGGLGMKGNRTRKWTVRLGIAGSVLLTLVVAVFVGWRVLTNHFVHRYHRDTSRPMELTDGDIDDYPVEFHLDDVPWIATREWTCSANSLAMIAAQHGTDASIRHCNFLMGFTYGASAVPGRIVVQFFGEPEAGLVAAAPYLGLERRYTITDDENLYLDALRYFLSKGYAVRLGLDVAVLYDLDEPSPHSEVLVGYDETGFRYYETVCLPEFPCEPGQLPPGEEGLWVSKQTLLEAVLSQAKMFSYPWRYSLTIFEEGPKEDDLGPIWTRNGEQLVGGTRYGPPQGADAIEGLAASVEKRGTRIDVSEVSPALGAGVYNRRDNAAHLREAFPGQGDVERAATLFERAAEDYESALEAMSNGIADQVEADRIATWLRDAATAEREVGEILLRRGH